jgi:hypothetical protein
MRVAACSRNDGQLGASIYRGDIREQCLHGMFEANVQYKENSMCAVKAWYGKL